jgi:hypothetical protein
MHGALALEQATPETAAEQATPEATPHQDAAATCSCVGHCCASSTAAPVPVVAAMQVPEAVAEVRHALGAPSRDVPASPALRLPFANGPPTV